MKRATRTLIGLALLAASAGASALSCDEAWAEYNEFKRRNEMEPSQYPLTVQGAAVRAACGPEALPVPPGSDTPPLPIIRKPHKPLPPPPPYKPKSQP